MRKGLTSFGLLLIKSKLPKVTKLNGFQNAYCFVVSPLSTAAHKPSKQKLSKNKCRTQYRRWFQSVWLEIAFFQKYFVPIESVLIRSVKENVCLRDCGSKWLQENENNLLLEKQEEKREREREREKKKKHTLERIVRNREINSALLENSRFSGFLPLHFLLSVVRRRSVHYGYTFTCNAHAK